MKVSFYISLFVNNPPVTTSNFGALPSPPLLHGIKANLPIKRVRVQISIPKTTPAVSADCGMACQLSMSGHNITTKIEELSGFQTLRPLPCVSGFILVGKKAKSVSVARIPF